MTPNVFFRDCQRGRQMGEGGGGGGQGATGGGYSLVHVRKLDTARKIRWLEKNFNFL